MTRRSLIAVACGLLAACAAAAGADKGIHITGGSTTGFLWTRTDGAGFRWDINQNGMVSDGTNNAYDGGMTLSVDGGEFSGRSPGRLSKDGREVEIGPWNRGSLRVWRRIYIDPKLGYCRWIDIFQNKTNKDYHAAIRYYSNLGSSIRLIVTPSGKNRLTGKDWGFVESYGVGRPWLTHVFGARGAKVRLNVQWTRGSDVLYYRKTLKIPAGKTVALCLFDAQRRTQADAVTFLKSFNSADELRKIPLGLRRIIVNMRSAVLTLGGIDLPRDKKLDLLVLRDETEQLGSILMDKYVVETSYGKIELPVERVVGVYVPAAADSQVHVALTDGQIVAGKLTNGPIRFRLANGNEMSLAPAKLLTIAYRISKDRPAELQPTPPLIDLRGGQMLRFETEDPNYTFHTEYGDLKLQPKDLASILLDTPEGGLHRAIFRNGSVLSGLLVAEDIKARLELGPTLDISRHLISRFYFAAESKPSGKMLALTLRNENVLYGRIAEKTIRIKTRFGSPTIAAAEIAELERVAGTLDRVRIELHNGTTVHGRLIGKTIRFQIEPGPELPIFVGHITRIAPSATATGKKLPATTQPVPQAPPRASDMRPTWHFPTDELRATAKELRKRKLFDEELTVRVRLLRGLQHRFGKLIAVSARAPTDASLIKALLRLLGQVDKTKLRIAELRKLLVHGVGGSPL